MVVLTPLTAKEMRSVTCARLAPMAAENFFGFKTGIRYHELIIPCRKSGKERRRRSCPTVPFLVRYCCALFEPAQ